MTFMWGKKYVGKTSISLKKHLHSTPFRFLNRSFNQKLCAVPGCDLPAGSRHGDWNCLEPLHTESGLRLQLGTALHSPVRKGLPAARLLGSLWLSWYSQPNIKAMASYASKCVTFLMLSWLLSSAKWFHLATLGSFSPVRGLIKRAGLTGIAAVELWAYPQKRNSRCWLFPSQGHLPYANRATVSEWEGRKMLVASHGI